MSARPASNNLRKKQHQLDAEAIQRREMADAAFEHWKKQKDKELLKKLVELSDDKIYIEYKPSCSLVLLNFKISKLTF